MAIYSVRAKAAVVGRGGKGTRRRGGAVFGAKPVFVSTTEGPGVQMVDKDGLQAILDDPYLESAEATAAEAKKVAAEAGAGAAAAQEREANVEKKRARAAAKPAAKPATAGAATESVVTGDTKKRSRARK